MQNQQLFSSHQDKLAQLALEKRKELELIMEETVATAAQAKQQSEQMLEQARKDHQNKFDTAIKVKQSEIYQLQSQIKELHTKITQL